VIHDLTHPIRTGLPGYPGDPPVRIDPWPDAAPWQVSAIRLGSHSGTHIDAPRHVDPAGPTIDQIPADRFVGRATVIPVLTPAENDPLGDGILSGVAHRLEPGSFALIGTGWDQYWGQETYLRHPYLSAALATALVDLGVGLVGVDVLSVDSTVDGGDAAHRILLSGGVLIVENLRHLATLDPARPYELLCLPLLLAGGDGAPVRAVARETDESKAQT
jgi:kynurenine formamidase